MRLPKNIRCVGCSVIILFLIVFEFSFDRMIKVAKYRARNQSCLSNLRVIGTRLTHYRQQHGIMPQSLRFVQKYAGDAAFHCPLETYPYPRADNSETGYLYQYMPEPHNDAIICWDRQPHHPVSMFSSHDVECRNVLQADGAVRTISEEQFSKMRLTESHIETNAEKSKK